MQSKLLIMTFLSVFIFCDSVSAYFDVIVDRMEQLGSTKFVDASSLKVRRVDKDRQLFGKIIYKVSLDDSVTAEVLLYLKTTAGYVLMPYKISKPFCDFYNGDPYFYPELAAVSDYEVPCPCPFLNQTVEIKGYSPSLKDVPTTIFKNGEYAFQVTYKQGKDDLFKVKFFITIISLE